LLFAAGGIQQGDLNGTDAWQMATGMTERHDLNTGTLSSDRNMFTATEQRSGGASVATGTRSFTGSHGFGNDDAAGVLMALRPSGTTGTAPDLIASPGQLSFTATVNGSNPANQTISVTNQGGTGDLTFTLSDNASWLSASASNSNTAPSTVTVSVDITGLGTGSYNGTLTIDPAEATDATITIPVALTVQAAPATAPDLRVTPTSLAFTATEDAGSPAAKTVAVSNIGGAGDVTFAVTDTATWLTVSPTSGSAPATLTVTVNTTGLVAAQYAATITVNPGEATATNQTVTVALVIEPNIPAPVSGELVLDAGGGALGEPLDISREDTGFGLVEHHYPLPPVDVMSVSTIDTEGEARGRIRYRNRTISIRLEVKGYTDEDDNVLTVDDVLDRLAAKLAKINRAGGTLQRKLSDGSVRTYDLTAVTSHEVEYDHKYYNGGVASVDLVLEARPFATGVEEELGTLTSAGPQAGEIAAQVPGDVHGLGRLVLDGNAESSGAAVWGVQQQFYNSSSLAALQYQAESLTLGSGVTSTAVTGASSGNAAVHTNLTTGTWTTIVSTGSRQHLGTFRMFARAKRTAGSGSVSLRLTWGPSGGVTNGSPVNSATVITNTSNEWALADLGLVTIPQPTRGNLSWGFQIDAQSTVAGDDVAVDWVLLVPVDDGYGQMTLTVQVLGANEDFEVAATGVSVQTSSSGDNWKRIGHEGDLLLLPPAGREGRFTRVIVKKAGTIDSSGLWLDPSTTTLTGTLFVTPRYL
jgi:hypothetical protein